MTRRRSLRTATVAAAIAIMTAAASLAGVIVVTAEIQNARREQVEIADAQAEVTEHVGLLRDAWSETTAMAQRLVTLARDATAGPPLTQAPDTLRAATMIAGPAFLRVTLLDLQGEVVWSTAAPRPTPVAQAELAAIATDRFAEVLSGPLTDPVTGRQALRLLYGAWDARGHPAGTISVMLDYDHVTRLERTGRVNVHDLVGVVDSTGRWLVSAMPQPPSVGPAPALPAGLDSDGVVTFAGDAPIEGPARIASFARLPMADLMAVVSVTRDAVLASHSESSHSLAFLSMVLGTSVIALGIGLVIALFIADIRQQRRLAAAGASERDALLRQIGWHSSAMIAVLDQDFIYLFASPASVRLLGVTPAELVGRKAGRLVAHGDRDRVTVDAIAAVAQGKVVTTLFRTTASAGEGRTLEVRLSPLRFATADGPPFQGMFMIVRDVTDQEVAAHTIQELRSDLELITRAGPGAIYHATIRPDGSRVMSFPCGTGRFALDLGADGIDTYERHLSAADQAMLRERLARLAHDGEATVEYRLRRPDGACFIVRDTCAVTVRHPGSIEVAGYLIDITREQQQSERLERARLLLGLGQMAVGLAHELNQPLAAITMAAENGALMLDQGAGGIDAARRKFDRVSALAMRAGDIIDQMRQFGRSGAGQAEPTDITECLEAAHQVVAGRLEHDRVALVMEAPCQPLRARANPGLLQQVLVNLMANACDALAEAGRPAPAIRVRARQADGMAVIEVADNAGGIPAGIIDQLFEPFFTTKAPGKGTGLGLSVSYGIIQRFGGTITATNRGDGAVFEIRLPVWVDAVVTA